MMPCTGRAADCVLFPPCDDATIAANVANALAPVQPAR